MTCLGIHVFDTGVLTHVLEEDAEEASSSHDFGKNTLPKMMVGGYRVYRHAFDQYWVDIGTLQAYWEAHMDLLDEDVGLDLLDREWVVHTRSEERPPANIRTGASIAHSLISDGCVIEGALEHSVLSPGVHAKAGALVRGSIIMTDSLIEEMSIIDRAIIDKNVYVGDRELGHAVNRARPETERHDGDP